MDPIPYLLRVQLKVVLVGEGAGGYLLSPVERAQGRAGCR